MVSPDLSGRGRHGPAQEPGPHRVRNVRLRPRVPPVPAIGAARRDRHEGAVASATKREPARAHRRDARGHAERASALQNVGVDAFLEVKLPALREHDTAVVANVFGETEAEYRRGLREARRARRASPPSSSTSPVRTPRPGACSSETTPPRSARITRACRSADAPPLWVKLSPNVTDIRELAKAAEAEGADARHPRQHVRRHGDRRGEAAARARERQRRPRPVRRSVPRGVDDVAGALARSRSRSSGWAAS